MPKKQRLNADIDKENEPNIFNDMPILERMDGQEMEQSQFSLDMPIRGRIDLDECKQPQFPWMISVKALKFINKIL